MNKYQEAYERVLVATNGGNGLALELNTLLELVDKATPNNPIDKEFGFGNTVFSCPCCKNPIINVWNKLTYKPKYCHYCGQALSWNESED